MKLLRRRDFRAADGRELVIVVESEGAHDSSYRLEDDTGDRVEEETLGTEDRRLVHAIVFDARDDEQARRADAEYAERAGK